MRKTISTLSTFVLLGACKGGDGGNMFESGATSADSTGSAGDGDGDGGIRLDVGGGDGDGTAEGGDGECPDVDGDAIISGTVFAPNQEIPVSGALVYASKDKPDGIPQTVYCAECVELECDDPFTITEPDGSFELDVPSGAQWIVVQKGQFVRMTQIDLAAGQNPLDVDVTSLPDHNDPAANLYIPKIAMAYGSYDRLEDGLAKLGLGDTLIDGMNYREELVPGTEQFDVWDNAGGVPDLADKGDFDQLLENYPLMEQYHIIFVPCSNDFALGAMWNGPAKDNVRKWVEAGGKFYVSDWSNEFVEEAFPGYQEFFPDVDNGGTDLETEYDSAGTVLDDDLLAWLEALPQGLKDINPQNGGGGFPTINNLPIIGTVNNWSGVEEVPQIFVDDGMGGQVNVGHKTWVSGPGDGWNVPSSPHPLTISGQYGCGKLMFTTYHMAEGSDAYIGLTPQELVLLYLILEIGVCQVPYEPPPPQG